MKEYPYWWDTVPRQGPSRGPQALPQPPAPRVFDVAIVGAGYTGLAAARHLARAGASVVVLERERAGWGASSRNGGQVLTGMKLGPSELVARFGEDRARQLFDISLESIASLEQLIADEAIECEYERTGHLQAAWKPGHFRAFREEQALLERVFRHRVELVSRARQESELGTDAYHGLLVDERSSTLNPARYAAGLAEAARRAGAVILEGCPATRLSRVGSRWAVETPDAEVDVGDVLVATDAYSEGFTPWLQRRLVVVGSYIIATEPLSPGNALSVLPRRRAAFDSKHFLYYWRLTRDNRLLFGGRAEFSRPDPDTTKRAGTALRTAMTRIFPQLSNVAVEYAWGGNVGFTRDQMPRAGRLDGMYYAGGYCGHGIAIATYLGTLIARRMGGEPIEHPLIDDRFPVIPFYDGNAWFLPLVGAYYATKDWLG